MERCEWLAGALAGFSLLQTHPAYQVVEEGDTEGFLLSEKRGFRGGRSEYICLVHLFLTIGLQKELSPLPSVRLPEFFLLSLSVEDSESFQEGYEMSVGDLVLVGKQGGQERLLQGLEPNTGLPAAPHPRLSC